MLLLYALLCVSPALSQFYELRPYNDSSYPIFLEIDVDGNRLLSEQEVDDSFKIYDIDSDSVVTWLEFCTYADTTFNILKGRTDILFKFFDLNKDDELTEPEFHALFMSFDRNDDGNVSPTEFIDFFAVFFRGIESILSYRTYYRACE